MSHPLQYGALALASFPAPRNRIRLPNWEFPNKTGCYPEADAELRRREPCWVGGAEQSQNICRAPYTANQVKKKRKVPLLLPLAHLLSHFEGTFAGTAGNDGSARALASCAAGGCSSGGVVSA